MKILLITQVFYPDTVSVSQHLTDLAEKLVEDGHEVTVYTSCYPYEDKTHRYSKSEDFQGVKIERLRQSSFGKREYPYPTFGLFHILLFDFNKIVIR